jgi:TrmH RNA methyltransferase
VYGLAAAFAAMRTRPDQVLSIAHTVGARLLLADMLSHAARLHIAYREVGDEELAKMAGTLHHEGVCLLVRPRKNASLSELARLTEPRGLIVALDQVGNPHNVGAVLRSAAFFGAAGVLASSGEQGRSVLTPAATRVAEGGAELLLISQGDALGPALQSLHQSGLHIVGSDVRAPTSLAALRWPERCVLVLGSEDRGLTPQVRKACNTLVRIEGSGALESLNVSVAAGVLLASYAATRS